MILHLVVPLDIHMSGMVVLYVVGLISNGSHSHLISQVCPINSGVNFSDHLPISFVLAVSPVPDALDSYSFEFIKCIVDSACHSIPCHSGRTLTGWNHGPKQLRSQANFWYQVSVEAGCPSNGVLSQIKKRGLSMLYGKSEGSKVISKGLGLLMRLVTNLPKNFGLVLSE